MSPALPLPQRQWVPRAQRAARAWGSDPLRLTLFVLVVLTISRANAHFPFLAPLRPLLLLSAAAVAFAFFNPRYLSGLPWTKTWPAKLVIALGLTACVSGVFGISMGGSARYFIEEYSKVLAVALLLMATMGSARDLHWYIWSFVVATGILVWDALFFFKMERAFGDQEFYRLSNLYTYDANDLGVVLLIGLALALYTFQMSRFTGKLVSLSVIIGIGAALAKTGSRGAFLGLIAFAVAIIVIVDSVSLFKRIGFILITGVTLVLASPQGYWKQMQTMLKPKEDYNWSAPSGRKQVVNRGLQYLSMYPVFGVGIGNFPMAEGTMSPMAKAWAPGDPGVRWSAPHNSFLQAGVEMGTVGLVLWCSLLGGIVWGATRLGRRLPREWRVGTFDQRVAYQATRYVPLAGAAFAASGAFVSFAYMDPIYYLAALTVGLLLVTRGVNGVAPLAAPRRRRPPRRG